jgi:hypothetical protein
VAIAIIPPLPQLINFWIKEMTKVQTAVQPTQQINAKGRHIPGIRPGLCSLKNDA